MARKRHAVFVLPDPDGWSDIVKDCRLSADQQEALNLTLLEVEQRCKGLDEGPTDREVKKALRALDKVYARLEHHLNRPEVVASFKVIEPYGTMGYILSSTALAEHIPEADVEISPTEIQWLIEHKEFMREPIRLSDLDRLCLVARQKQLHTLTAEAMKLVVGALRVPISTWLTQASHDTGGNAPKIDRDWLITLLARDSNRIIGAEPSYKKNSKFFKLCCAVIDNCGFDSNGHEDAVEGCLKKYGAWIEWDRLPEHEISIKSLSAEEIEAIESGPEPDLK